MSRTERKISKTKIYHIMSRGLDKQLLFFDEIDYLKYLSLISELQKDYGVEIIAYCLMSNHIHMIIFDKKDLLAQFIGKLNARFAMYYNKKNFRVGYVFSGRFKSECIENGEYLLKCIRYIHQNPVKSKICKKTYEYKFSSIHAYRSDKGNYLNIVNTNRIYNKIDKKYFLSWNEETNNDKFLEVISNKLTDKEVLLNLYKYCNVKMQKEFNILEEPIKIVGALKLIDDGISIMQISRVSGIAYNRIQKLKKGQEGKIASLAYFPK